MNSKIIQEKFQELMFYTLAHDDQVYFIHQHVVDAYPLQTANDDIKPITFTYCLIGLYLYLKQGYTGRQVQLAHMKLAKKKVVLKPAGLPQHRGDISVIDVLAALPGAARDQKINEWCASVWNAYETYHEAIARYAQEQLGV